MNLNESKGGLQIKKEAHRISIEKPWNRLIGGILIGFSVIWTGIAGFIGFSFIGGLIKDLFTDPFQAFHIIVLLFGIIPLLFILLGVAMFISGVAMLVNKTTIVAEGDLLTINHSPIPVIRSRKIPKQAIRQIFVQEMNYNRSNNSPTLYNQDGNAINVGVAGRSTGFQLSYINQQNQMEPLLGKLFGLPLSMPTFSLEESQALEKLLEEHFNIKDEAVQNEAKKERPKNLNSPEFEEEYSGRVKEEEESLYNANESPYFEETSNYPDNEKSNPLGILATPRSLMVEENMDGLFIFKKWRSPIAIFYLIFGAIWNSIVWTIASFIFPVLFMGNSELWYFALFLIPFIGIGIYILFAAFAIIFNTTTIHVHGNDLIVQHSPLPAGKNFRIAISDLSGLEITSQRRSGKNGSYWIYSLEGLNKDGSRLKLLKGTSFLNFSEEELTFLKTKLSGYLKLKA